MAQRAINWDLGPQNEAANDPDCIAPTVLPVSKPHVVRRVGVIKAYSARKRYGLVEIADAHSDAIFNIDDVNPCDQPNLDCGQTVTFHAVTGPDGLAAKDIRIDATTLPPMPGEAMLLKGWR
ncbi:MAG: cold shock domain-containing protein [Alphaproteobacteria bacterium]|nr:cold shock domain-containing protein [Alphaproteobacteria bacterium]